MKIAVVHIGHIEAAEKLAKWLEADVLDYDENVLEHAFTTFEAVVTVMASGIVIRKIAPLLNDKWTDPAILLVTPDLRFCIPLLGGHHGANELARKLDAYGVVSVISTATDVLGRDSVEEVAMRNHLEVVNKSSTVAVNKSFLAGDVPVYCINGPAVVLAQENVSVLSAKGEYVIGIGCNRGTGAEEVVQAIRDALQEQGIGMDQILAFTSTEKKYDEQGLLAAVREIGGRLFFIDDHTINAQPVASRSKAELIGLIGVAEPSALALAKRKELIMKRRAYGNVTIAIAR